MINTGFDRRERIRGTDSILESAHQEYEVSRKVACSRLVHRLIMFRKLDRHAQVGLDINH